MDVRIYEHSYVDTDNMITTIDVTVEGNDFIVNAITPTGGHSFSGTGKIDPQNVIRFVLELLKAGCKGDNHE